MTHLVMRLQTQHARSRRCQLKAGTAGGRPRALRWPRGHTHTRWAWRPIVSRRRPCSLSRPEAQERRCLHATPTERRRVAQEATPAVGRLCNVPLRWLCAGRFAAIQGGFLRCAWSAADLTPSGCGPGSSRAAGAASALGPRLDLTGSPGPAAATLGRGAPSGQPRRLPLLPAVLRQRLYAFSAGSAARPAIQRSSPQATHSAG